MFNRGTYNSFKYNSIQTVGTVSPVIPTPTQQAVGGNFKKKRRIRVKDVYLEIPVCGIVYRDLNKNLLLIADKTIKITDILNLISNLSVNLKYARLVKSDKVFDVNEKTLIKSDKIFNFEKELNINGILLNKIISNYLLNIDVSYNEKLFLSIKSNKEIFLNHKIILNTSKIFNYNQEFVIKGKKDIQKMLIYGLMDI